jgi:hypothetical protein
MNEIYEEEHAFAVHPIQQIMIYVMIMILCLY